MAAPVVERFALTTQLLEPSLGTHAEVGEVQLEVSFNPEVRGFESSVALMNS